MGRAQDVENEEQEQENADFFGHIHQRGPLPQDAFALKQPDPNPDHGDQGDHQRNQDAEFAGGIDPRIRDAEHHDEAADLNAPMPHHLLGRAHDRTGFDGGRR
ncbi:MAG: hypothetical protein ACR2OO_06225 [Thermomicrobiales bacterium]